MKPGRAKIRCAIYTRKSTEEGLDQAFNSLDAQREACEAYVRSQVGEGWTLLSTCYDDGGFSGGNMARPAIKQLLEDVDAGKVDVIVVYKVDRLTRSLMDFARIVDRLDARDVSFVSITQAFNTTTSMGRLTLNVLLSFAQFEREVTGERIRDKIAASKAKGIWMGGNLPLGYDLGERQLVPNPAEAEQVQHIFRRYLELGSVPKLVSELRAGATVSKRWTTRTGRVLGGMPLRCGAVYYLLQNRLYVGEIVHREVAYPGEHEAIVPVDLFEQVQQRLTSQRQERSDRPRRAAECALTGIIFGADGKPMGPSFSYGHGGKMYRYYVSVGALPGSRQTQGVALELARVPARRLDDLVLRLATKVAGHNHTLSWQEAGSLLTRVEVRERSIQLVIDLSTLMEPHEQEEGLVERLRARLDEERLMPEGGGRFRLICDRRAKFRGGLNGASDMGQSSNKHESQRLMTLLRKAHMLLEQHSASPMKDNFSTAQAPPYQRERRIMQLGLLAPDVQRRIIEGRTSIRADRIAALDDMPLAWADQRQLLSL